MLRATGTVTFLSVLVQIVGFVRTSMIAAGLGASLHVDAYNLSLIAPTFISAVVSGWLQTSFVGRYGALLTRDEVELAAAYRTRMLGLVALIAFASALLLSVQAQRVIAPILPVGSGETLRASALALQIVAWTLPPLVIGDFLGLVLNSHGRFLAAALAPLISVLVSVTTLWQWPTTDLDALVWTLLIGNLAQAAIVLVAWARLGLGLALDTRSAIGEVAGTIRLAPALVAGIVLGNAAVVAMPIYCARLGEGAVATFGYASRLHGALTQVLVMGLGTVLLPHLATLWAQGAKDEVELLFRRLARIGILIAAYLFVGVLLMGETAVAALLNRGRFDAEATRQVANVWSILSLSLFPLAFGTFIAKFASALRRSDAILASGAVLFATTWGAAYLGSLAGSLALISGAAAASAAFSLVLLLLWVGSLIPVRPILMDILEAAARTTLVLAPAAAAELTVASIFGDVPSLASVGVRGVCYTSTVGLLVLGLGWHRWFLLGRK